MKDEDPAELEGTVTRIVYTNPDNHWTVLRVTPTGAPRPTAVVGTLAGIREGESVRIWGKWVDDQRYGRQLRATRYHVVLPATAQGIERYLASGMIPGIGPKTAKLLVKRFGAKTFDVIEKNPQRLAQVKGIGKKKIAQLLDAWRQQSMLRDTMSFLLTLGISPALSVKIFSKYGPEAANRVRTNPYDLAQDVWGIGFLKADRIARELEIREDDPARLRAGIVHVLKEARSDGHVCLPREELLQRAESLLGGVAGLLGTELGLLEGLGRVAVEQPDDLVYLPDLFSAERRAAEQLVRLIDGGGVDLPEQQIELVVRRAEGSLGLELAEAQRDAVLMSLGARVSVITGGPGTGKTTIVRAIVEALCALGDRVALAAPTGRASKRLADSTRRDARTIHRLLEWQPNDATFARDEHNPLEFDSLIIDEVSMVDLPLFDAVLRALPDGARLLLVGDVDQLPSVGPGAVLRDVIRSEVVEVTQLTAIFRQAEGSWITANAHRILRGELPESPGDEKADFYWIERDDPQEIRRIISRMIIERIPAAFGLDPCSDVQVLTPMHRGPLGSEGLNDMLGRLLNPGREESRLTAGDKVMQIRNNYEKEVFNGDVGFVERIADDGRTLVVRFDEGSSKARLRMYEPVEQDQLVPAWAISIHKSQGSEYPAVVVPLHTQHYMMLRRNLVYTAVTRGKKLVVLVGSRRALRMAVSAGRVRPRHGLLADRLREAGR